MKKEYFDPKVELVDFDEVSVLTGSGTTDGTDDWGDSPIW